MVSGVENSDPYALSLEAIDNPKCWFLIPKVTEFTSVDGSGDAYYQALEAIENPTC